MKHIVLMLFFIAVAKTVTAQQDPQFTQYMYNPLAINPAYAGNRETLSILGLHRSQWVGLEGAPRTQSLSLHTPLGYNRLGLGLTILNDEIGPANETYIAGDFSYSIPVGDDAKISFGLKAGVHLLNVDFGKLNPDDQSDPRVTENVNNRTSPLIGTGIFYNTDKFYLGLSTPNLLQTDHFDEDNTSNSSTFVAQERIHYFAMMGYVFDVNDAIKFKPATMLRVVQGSPLQLDLSANFLFNEKFTVGAAYRWDTAVSGLVGFQINEKLLIGFSYDRETTELGNQVFNDGSLELFLRFELFDSYGRILTPRFF